MNPVWVQRREEVWNDCLVSPDVFTQMVHRLGEFVVPYVRRDSSLHIATQVDWNSKECSRGRNYPGRLRALMPSAFTAFLGKG